MDKKIILIIVTVVGVVLDTIQAQTPQGYITGQLKSSYNANHLSSVNIVLKNTRFGTTTNEKGEFQLGPLPEGNYQLKASYLGYQATQQSVNVPGNDTVSLSIQLKPRPILMQGVEVKTLNPGLQAKSEMEQNQIREANPVDVGGLMREQQGTEAVRRGSIGLDPVIRGLRETQVGTYVNGMRIFSGGPARMDAPLSHIDPSAVQSIEIVKGPYALTWGAGNLSAIRVKTRNLWHSEGWVNGSLEGGYQTNFNAADAALSFHGNGENLGYRLQGSWRTGNDYTSGNGTQIPSDYLSRGIRGKLGYKLTPQSTLTISGGYQNQQDIEYPGRLLNADYFRVYDVSARWKVKNPSEIIQSIEVLGYYNKIAHGMDNDGKPTAKADSNRMPPFALDISVDAEVETKGGRARMVLDPAKDWEIELGSDGYRTYKEAFREIGPADKEMVKFADFMWPKATLTNLGAFVRAEHHITDDLKATGTVRGDLFQANADTLSAFFQDEVSRNRKSHSRFLSGSATLNYSPFKNWAFFLAMGSAVRPPDAKELYSDRIPASKAQTSAEFVGNPNLKPERNNQIDLGIEGFYQDIRFSITGFYRKMEDYITLEPTNLPKRLPLSPSTVYRYVNGSATFQGIEGSLSYRLLPSFKINGGLQYLWGQDHFHEEPALGIAPLKSTLGLRFEPEHSHFFIQNRWELVDGQNRVAEIRGEDATDGYITTSLKAGVQLVKWASLQVSANNLFDAQYTNHLNAKNPFTGRQISEPGRHFALNLKVEF